MAERVARRGDFDVRVRRPAESADEGAARIWIGDAETPAASGLLARLSVQRTASGFRVGRAVFDQRDDVLVATFEDPKRPGLPLTMWYGNDLLYVERAIEDLTPAWRPGLRCLRAGREELEVELSTRGEAWLENARVVGDVQRAARAGARRETIEPFEVELPAEFDLQAWRKHYFSILAPVLQRVEITLGGNILRPGEDERREWREPTLRVYASAEDFARATGRFDLWRLDPASNTVDVLLALRLCGGRADARLGAAAARARALAGDPAAPWLFEALAAEASGFWWGVPLNEWVAYLTDGDLLPPLRELSDASSKHSPHLLVPLRAMLVRYLVASKGVGAVRTLWGGTREFQWNAKLKAGFEAALAANLERERESVRQRRAGGRARSARRAWRAGVALRPALGSARGYGSEAARASLAAARGLGANAFSVDLFAYVEPGLPERAGVPPPARSAADVALAATIAEGRALGMGAMLKLYLVQGRAGNFAGYRGMEDEDWAPFFDEYERQVVHAGLLAELAGAEILCLGSGVPLPTATRPQEDSGIPTWVSEQKRARWQVLIAKARGAFSGALTYGARWQNQAYAIDFWPQLDYLGVQVFHAVCDPQEPWRRQADKSLVAMMRKNLTDLAQLAAKLGKPLLATEVGFPATDLAWQEPYAARGAVDAAVQAEMLALWRTALAAARGRRPELAGFFLWSWPVDAAAGAGTAGLFSPRGRPAEAELERLLRAR